MSMKKIVLTGGPSVGKTTVIEILAKRFYAIAPEAARLVIEEERLKKSDALPWKDIFKFQTLVAERQLKLEAEAKSDLIFFDRGLVDGSAYCKVNNLPTPQLILENSKNRYDKVFFLESLGLYVEDGVRSKDFEDAEKIHNAIKQAYVEFGYDPITVPVLPPEQRVDFILSLIK